MMKNNMIQKKKRHSWMASMIHRKSVAEIAKIEGVKVQRKKIEDEVYSAQWGVERSRKTNKDIPVTS